MASPNVRADAPGRRLRRAGDATMTALLSGIFDLRAGVRAGALFVALAGALLVPGAPALAASGTYACADLQSGLDQAVAGDVITLSELCTKDNSGGSNGSFSLPGAPITLQGVQGAGFDGTGAASRVLTGHDVGSTVIAGLIFRNSVAPTGLSGGAVLIDGNSAPTFQSDQFYSNGADGLGGAVAVLAPAASSGTVVFANSVVGSRSGGEGNHATSGGALFIQSPRRVEVRSNLFAGNAAGDTGGAVGVSSSSEVLFASNLVEGNSAAAGGGGAQLCCGQLTITSNAFRANKVDDSGGAFPTHRGGGLLATSSEGGGPGHAVQFGNVFDQNSVSFANSSASGGGGEYLIGSSLDSRNDLFLTNAVQGPAGGGESRGAGLRSTGCNGGELLTKVENGVLVGNVLGAAGAGAAVSVTCGTGVNHLSLLDTTVAGNATPDGAAALDGGGADTALAANSIVVGAGPPLAGFGAQTVTHSDVCDAASQPFAGDANICADPRLVNPSPGSGNFHETPSSPTIDAGANTLLAGDLTVDADGDERAQDGNGDGEAVVDMGADESPAVPLIPPQERPKPPVVGPDVPGPAPPVVEVITKPNKVNRVVYVRIVISKKRGRYLATRISGTRSKARIRLRLLDGRHRSHSVTRTVRTNRPITLRNLPLVGVKLIRVSVIK
jgi:hypothetical protein